MTLEERKELADSPVTPAEILVELSKDDEDEIRFHVGKNPNTPSETLVKLSKDENVDVRGYAVVLNPNTPVETLTELSRDSSTWVRSNVAKNPKWKILEEMGALDQAILISKYLGIL